MIDKQQFNNFFQHFDKEMIIEVIDLFAKQSPELINALSQNIEDHDLVQVKLNAHKLKGICLQLYDPVSAEHARNMEDTARRLITEIINLSLREYPKILNRLNQEFNENALVLEVVKYRSVGNFISGLAGSMSADTVFDLQNTEKNKVAEDLPRMLSELTVSADELLRELMMMKRELV
jgi:HPt (histidine-containing phosphotransfer) domain-containing protein